MMGKPMEPKYRLEKVFLTRSLQKRYLENNCLNRPVSDRSVKEHRRQMRTGIWQDTGQTMSVARNGKLLNGQHRILAMYRENLEYWVAMAYDVEESAFVAMDTGRLRTGGDVVATRYRDLSKRESKELAMAVRWHLAYKGELLRSSRAIAISNEELLGTLDAHSGFFTAVEFMKSQPRHNMVVPRSMGTFFHYEFSRVAPIEITEYFLKQLYDGDLLRKDTPLWRVRERLLWNKTRRYIEPSYISLLRVIKAWNCNRKHEYGYTLRTNDICTISEGISYIAIK